MADLTITTVIVIAFMSVAYPFWVILTFKLAAYGWFRGKQEFNKQEKLNGYDKAKEEETGTGLR